MARRVSASQLRSRIRRSQQKRRQAINKYNQAVRKYNRDVKRVVNKYNQDVRTYNSRVRANRQRIKRELASLSRRSTTKRYTVFRTSVHTMHESYVRLERRVSSQDLNPTHEQIIDLSGRETANSLEVMNLLLGNPPISSEDLKDLQTVKLTDELRGISSDLDERWRGAVFSLNPRNPDAARHFCISAREIFTQILEIKAPDSEVIDMLPDCGVTELGKPTRRSKIHFFLHKKGMSDDALEDFVEQDLENIVQLFKVFNVGAHGSAGKFDMQQLSSLKKRVEHGIHFLSEIVN